MDLVAAISAILSPDIRSRGRHRGSTDLITLVGPTSAIDGFRGRLRRSRRAPRAPGAARRGCCRCPSQASRSPSQSVTTPPASRTMSDAGSHVPGPERQLEVAVEHALGGPAEVEAGPARPGGDPRSGGSPCRRRARSGRADPCAGTGTRSPRSPAPACARSRGAAARRGTRRRRARAAVGAVEQRGVHDGDHRLAGRDQADRHADRLEAVHEVRRAVERVDEPADLGALAALFLAEHRQARSRVRAPRAPRSRSRRRRRSPSRRAPSRARRAARRSSARTISPPARAARSAATSSASRSSSGMVHHRARRRVRASRRRRAGGAPWGRRSPARLRSLRARPRRLRCRRGNRRDSPTARGATPSRDTRRCRRPRRRTARARHSRARGTASTPASTADSPRARRPQSSRRVTDDAWSRTPSRWAPAPRTAVVR